jgi:hypothetical protein
MNANYRLPTLTISYSARPGLNSYVIPFIGQHPPLTHNVVSTLKSKGIVTPDKPIGLTTIGHNNLDFALGTASKEHDICVYSMQVCPLQQDFEEPINADKIKESSDLIPRRIQQSVHGYLPLMTDYPTRLNLRGSWDKNKVSSLQVCMEKVHL